MRYILKTGVIFTMVSLLLWSCEPQELDDRELGPLPQEQELDFSVNETDNPNVIELEDESSRPGVALWEFGNGNSAKGQSVKAEYPVKGSYDVEMTLLTDGGHTQITKTIEIEQDDFSLLSPMLEALVRDSEGKSWEFAGTPGDGGLWWFMAEPDNPDGHMSFWWNAGGDGAVPPSDVDGRMHFDIIGGNNYTYYSGPNAEPQEGSFILNTDKSILTLNDAPVLGHTSGEGVQTGSEDGEYQIMSLTEDELVLYVPFNEYETGWTWVFRPVEE
ncbi:MAG: PKD domain-containing protein [Bacteroidota bacterium]